MVYMNYNFFFFPHRSCRGRRCLSAQNTLCWNGSISHNKLLTHTKNVDYNQMYWYRQYHGKSMELIVFTTSYGTLDFGKFDKNKFLAFKPNPGSGSFTVKSVDYNDAAVYFCAVSKHSVTTTSQSCTKTYTLCQWLVKNILRGQCSTVNIMLLEIYIYGQYECLGIFSRICTMHYEKYSIAGSVYKALNKYEW